MSLRIFELKIFGRLKTFLMLKIRIQVNLWINLSAQTYLWVIIFASSAKSYPNLYDVTLIFFLAIAYN
jgi:hypothetical protein